MIRGERVIQLNMAMLILVGSLLLSIAQNDWTVFFVTAALVTFSTLVVDWLKILSFHPIFANALAFVVSFISFTQFVGGNAGTKLNAVANLLTYLQLVLLLQKKSPRLYWQIMMLSLLQVVVAAALNLEFGAGMVFFGYIILVVVGTIHLKIYRSNYRMAEREKSNDEKLESFSEGNGVQGLGVVTFRASELEFRDQKKIAWQGILLCVCALFFAFSVFFSMPRFGSAWYGPNINSIQQTGFTTEIRFDDNGFLFESNKKVMRATFLDEEMVPIELAIEPYFRGLVLTDYEYDNASWTWRNNRNSSPGRRGQGGRSLRVATDDKLSYIRQIIRLEPGSQVKVNSDSESVILFSLYPAYQTANTPDDLVFNRLKEIMFSDGTVSRNSGFGPYNYEILVPLYRRLGQLPAVPVSEEFVRDTVNQTSFKEELNRLTGKSVNLFYNDWLEITRLASQIISKIEGPKTRRIICNRFVNHLKRAEFKYTRDLGSIPRNPDEDPIVDFLLNHKSGHCEYFATGLALLLRSQDIPCRVVTGFRGGEFNPIGGFYDVREKHAHVWVEAYLPLEECDAEMLRTGQASELGAWLRLDPTPGADLNDYGTPDTLIDRAVDTFAFVQKVWDDYVMGLDQDTREVNGFDPTKANMETWGVFGQLRDSLDKGYAYAKSLRWWQWVVGVLVFLSLTIGLLCWRAIRKLRKTGEKISTRNVFAEILNTSANTMSRIKKRIFQSARPVQKKIDFYDDFIELMKGFGFQRQDGETQAEFANKVVAGFADQELPQLDQVAAFVNKITKLFYAARFGKESDEEQFPNAQSEVVELKKILKKA